MKTPKNKPPPNQDLCKLKQLLLAIVSFEKYNISVKQLSFDKVSGWGGRRRGAGRKKSGLVSHAKRERVDLKTPLHITLKLKPRVASLRTRELHKAFRKAVGNVRRFGLFVIHYSLQDDHVHMFVEAKNSHALSSGLKSLGSSFGKAIRKVVGGKGSVFIGRYHLHVLRNPTLVKNALKYVLLNFSKHTKLIEYIDEFSSGNAFKEWRALLKRLNPMLRECVEESWRFRHPELSTPQSWLAREGWKRAA